MMRMMGVIFWEKVLAARCWRMFERKERRGVEAIRNVLGNSSIRMTFLFAVSGGGVGDAIGGVFADAPLPVRVRLAKFPLRPRKSSNWEDTER